MIGLAADILGRAIQRCSRRLTITRGAMIQLTTMLNVIWIHNVFAWNEWCNVSKRILQRIGYIMISRPIAKITVSQVDMSNVATYLAHLWVSRRQRIFLSAMLGQFRAQSFQE